MDFEKNHKNLPNLTKNIVLIINILAILGKKFVKKTAFC